MTEKEFKALRNGKPVKWDSGEDAERYVKEYEEKKKGDAFRDRTKRMISEPHKKKK